MGALACCLAKLTAPLSLVTISGFTTPAFAAGSDIGPADTARMIVTAVLVLMMTVPGLALFRGTAGLLEGNLHLLLTQLYGVAVTMAWSAGVTYVLLEPVSDFVPLRISLSRNRRAGIFRSMARHCRRFSI